MLILKFKRIFNLILMIALTFIFTAGCDGNTVNDNTSPAPDFTLLNLQDDPVSLSDYRGKPVLINFFATYCPPCRMEMHDFVRLVDEYGERGFTVLAISVDQNPQKALPQFIHALKLNFPVLVATSKVLEDYGNVYALPVSFMLDKDHKILKHFTGMVTEEDIVPLLDAVFSQKES